jgi:hypothetical protein
MLKRRWIEPKVDVLGTWYELTELGNAIANVRFVKRIDRTTANKLIADLLDRVDGINEDGDIASRKSALSAATSPTRSIWVISIWRCALRANWRARPLPMPA